MNEVKQFIKKFIPLPSKKGEDLYKLTIDKMAEIEARKTPKAMLDYEVQLV